jgi:50S ribosomal subunit-associated GTPase HflX
VVGELAQARDHPDPATYLGWGKVEELVGLVKSAAADVAVVELSPAQLRNLEDRACVRVVDRTAPPDRADALQRAYPDAVRVPARTGEGLDRLRQEIGRRLEGAGE